MSKLSIRQARSTSGLPPITKRRPASIGKPLSITIRTNCMRRESPPKSAMECCDNAQKQSIAMRELGQRSSASITRFR